MKQENIVSKFIEKHPKRGPNDMAIRSHLKRLEKEGITYEDLVDRTKSKFEVKLDFTNLVKPEIPETEIETGRITSDTTNVKEVTKGKKPKKDK